ncbi:MAG: hypothetical protein LBR80_10505 [Deltaproteobacteria bacterium]|jgi:hypothetical protein|nr:hypothetical protein [Deltaproteobacteria bacterium]
MPSCFGDHLNRDRARFLAFVLKALGHRSPEITARNIGLDDAAVDAAVDRLGFSRRGLAG